MAGHCPSGFFGRQQNSCFHLSQQVFQVLKQQNSPRPSHYHHHILLLVWCSFSEMLCYFYTRCDTISKKFNFYLVSLQSIFPKVLGIIKIFFWQNWDNPLFFLLSSGFRLGDWAIFAQSLSYGGVMNTDLNWGKWGLQFFRCCCEVFCDLLDESSLRSWGNFGRPANPGKVHHCSMFLPFVENGSHCGSLES